MNRAALSIEGSKISVAIAGGMPWNTTVLKRMEEDLPREDAQRVEALRELVEKLRNDYGVKTVVVGLEPAMFTHNFINLPVTGRQDVAHALSFELEKYLPLPPDEYVLDYYTMRNDAGGVAGSRNLVISARKDKLSWIAEALADSGVSLAGLRCTAFEVLGKLQSTRRADSCLFIYQGAESAALISLEGDAPASLSFRPLGDNPEDTVSSMLEGYEGNVIVAGVEGIPTYTGERISTVNISPADALLFSKGKGRPYPMDFTPPELVLEKVSPLPVVMAALAGLCVLVFFMTTLLAYYKDYSALSSVQDRLKEIRTSSKGLIETKRETEVLQKKLKFLREFQAGSNKHIRLLSSMSRILPDSAWLTSLSVGNGDTVEIGGFALRTADIIRPLEKSDAFSDVVFSSPVTVRASRERFSIKMKVTP